MRPGPDGPRTRRRAAPEGDPTVFVADEQAAVPVDVERLGALAEHVLLEEGVHDDCELSLNFVDETTIADLNARFLGGAGPTDVLAFPIDDDLLEPGRSPDGGGAGPDRPPVEPGDVPVLLGDVMVCPAVAARNAADHGRDVADELALLVVHGVLHVLGHDHDAPAAAAAMGERQRTHLAWYDPASVDAPVADPESHGPAAPDDRGRGAPP